MANGSRHALYFVEENTYGTTPTSPALKTLRHKSCSLALTKDSFQSEELRSDRQISDFRHGNYQIGGDIEVELSYGTFDDILEGVLCGDWVNETPASGTDQLKAGTTRHSYSILRHFGDLAAGNTHHLFKGVEFSKLSMTVSPNAIVGFTLSTIGQDMALSASAPSGSTYPAATTTSPMDSFSGTISENGTPIALITEIQLDIENGQEARFVVGDAQSLRPSIGRSNVTGTVTAYFENTTLLEKFINETESDIVFTLVDQAGNAYEFTIPRIKYTGGQPDVSGEGDITLAMPFQALLDSSVSTNLIIERTAA
jgi:hypothetical protein